MLALDGLMTVLVVVLDMSPASMVLSVNDVFVSADAGPVENFAQQGASHNMGIRAER